MAKLSINVSESENKPQFHFFCINTSLNDYHFCWALNETLHLNLTRINDFSNNETSMQSFSVFQDTTTNSVLRYSLLALKSENGLLMKDLSGFDFLLCLDGKINKKEIEKLQTAIATIKNVLLITNLENKKTKTTTIADLSYLMEMIG
jgi:hypothetical protein